jgi:DNA polymerase elongation subunit (family B)
MSHFYTNAFLHKNHIYYTGYENGKRVKRKVEYQPYLFLPDLTGTYSQVRFYKTLEGHPVIRKDFSSISEANKFIREHKDVSNFTIYGNTNFLYTWINDTFPGQMEYDSSLVNVIFLDIEVESDKGLPNYRDPICPVNAITIAKHGKKITFGCGEYKPKGPNSAYMPCKNEAELLRQFLKIWNSPSYNPDILTGWHVEGFDIPYLYNRIKKLLGSDYANKLSPWGVVEEREKTFKFKDTIELTYDLKGISTLDYLQLYKKFSFKNHESYALNFIANEELGEEKVDYSEYESLLELYTQDYEKFINYNIRDVELVEKLDDKLKLIEQVFAIAYDAKVTYADTLTTVRMWDTIIHNYLLDQQIVVPPMKKNPEEELLGAYVKEPQLGMHKWVVSFDLVSLYPRLIMQYNIGPDTFVGLIDLIFTLDEVIDGKLKEIHDNLKEKDVTITANLCCYRRDKQGFLGALMEKVYKDRDIYKKGMIEAKQAYEKSENPETRAKLKKLIAQQNYMQMAKKIQMNSGYGAIANPYFRYYNHNDAEAITATGQLAIRWVESRLNKTFNKLLKTIDVDYIIASDTDSLYVNFEPIVEKRWKGCDTNRILKNIDAACKTSIIPFIDKCYEDLAEYTNAYKNCMQMNREVIAEKGLWTAKKRYILNVWDSEGVRYKEPELKISGIESVRSSTPSSCRDYIEQALKIIMNGNQDDLQKFIKDFRNEFTKLPVTEVAFPRSISGLVRYKDSASIYKKSTPIQVKGALIYNHLISKNGLDKKYPLIYNGDKVKFVYLKEPNPLHVRVISFINALPQQFGVGKYIDYETQFDKGFLAPIETVLDAIGWKSEQEATLEEFM